MFRSQRNARYPALCSGSVNITGQIIVQGVLNRCGGGYKVGPDATCASSVASQLPSVRPLAPRSNLLRIPPSPSLIRADLHRRKLFDGRTVRRKLQRSLVLLLRLCSLLISPSPVLHLSVVEFDQGFHLRFRRRAGVE